MDNLPKCPQCNSDLTYENGLLFVCPECGHEWVEKSIEEKDVSPKSVKDAFGNVLNDGDSVTIIKDIKVKGASSDLKIGLKVKDIRIVEEINGHNIEAKVPGFGQMMLKSSIVKKSS